MKKKLYACFLCFTITLIFYPPAYAQPKQSPLNRFPGADFSALRLTGTQKVVKVVDPLTLQLEDGRLIHLTGIDIPDLNPYAPGQISQTALRVLNDWLLGKAVNIHQSRERKRTRINRMGHHIAHLEVKDNGAWVQGALLALGLARTKTVKSYPEMADQMYSLEELARAENLGLWSFEAYNILSPADALDHAHSFQIIKGRVESAAMNQNRIYLNFGKNWKTDFTVSIAPEDRSRFFKSRLDPLKLNGRTIRVRGWIEDYNGPYIEIDHPERIEVLHQKG